MVIEQNLHSLLNEIAKPRFPQMPERVEEVLREMEMYERENPRMRNVTRELGKLLYYLVIRYKAKHILELGTSNGYSTIWLAVAAKSTGSKVTTVENQVWKGELARQNIEKAGLSDVVMVVSDDALKISGKIDNIDFLFMDIWPGDYLTSVKHLIPKMTYGSLVVCDNLLTHRNREGIVTARGEEGDDYLIFVRDNFKSSGPILNIGSGVQISVL